MTLSSVEVRVLGALIEKEIATPETYPLSLNALVSACNQRSSREPVMDLDEAQVRQALHGLDELGLVSVARDSRVAKFEHRARTVLNLRRDETAILCLLLLRGPQTAGELRARADRLYAFDGLEAVEATLQRLASREPADAAPQVPENVGALAVLLARQPGAREARWAHLLGGESAAAGAHKAESTGSGGGGSARSGEAEMLSRVERIERELAELRTLVESLTTSQSAGSTGT